MKPRIRSMFWNVRKQKTTDRTTRRKKNQKNEDSVNTLQNNFEHSNICIIGVPEEEKQQEIGNLFEKIMKENFPNLVKEIDIQVQEVQRIQVMMDAKRPTPRRVIITRPKVKDKERLLKAREKNLVTCRGVSIRLSADF